MVLKGVGGEFPFSALSSFSLDGGKRAFSNTVLVETNFEASKPLFLKAFRSLKGGLD